MQQNSISAKLIFCAGGTWFRMDCLRYLSIFLPVLSKMWFHLHSSQVLMLAMESCGCLAQVSDAMLDKLHLHPFPEQVESFNLQHHLRMSTRHTTAQPGICPNTAYCIKTVTGCESNRQLQFWTVFAGTVVYITSNSTAFKDGLGTSVK